MDCVVIADSPGALVNVCGVSVLERLLRTLKICGFTHAVISTNDEQSLAQALRAFQRSRIVDTSLRRGELLALWPADSRNVLVLRGDRVFDPRLVRLLAASPSPVALVDSEPPTNLLPLVENAGRFCGAASLSPDSLTSSAPLEDVLRAAVDDGTLGVIDVAKHSWYSAELHREVRAYWFPAPSREQEKLAETVILDAAQKGTLDVPALVHAPIENFIVGKLCKTRVTPNQLTLFCNIVAWGATALFATGHLGAGITVALAVGVLDGLDGKLARVKLETSEVGKLEHLFDVFFENSWWIAIAYHLHVSGKVPAAFAYLGLLIGAEVLNALARNSIVRYYRKSMCELGAFDRAFRLISGRRNIYVWIMALGVLFGTPGQAFKLIAWWEVVTAVVHLTRATSAVWLLRSQRSGA